MKVLSIGNDRSVLDTQSAVAKRLRIYGTQVARYDVLVPAPKRESVPLSDRVTALGSGGLVKPLQLFNLHCLAKHRMRERVYDVVTVQDPYYLGFVGYMLARKFQIGLEVQVHGWEQYTGFRKILAKFLLSRADAVRVVSKRLQQQLVESFGVQEERITVVPIYSEVRSREYEARKKESEKFVFLTVGRLVPIKNMSMQIEVFSDIIKKHPKTELWIVGEGEERKKLESEIKNQGLEKNIQLYGQKKNLESFYKQADAFVLTSDYEGWGLVVIEAASYGLPIIMTDVGCAGEVIKNEESGLVIPVDDTESLARAMLRIREDGNLRSQLAKNAHEAIMQLPTLEKTLVLYKQSWTNTLKYAKIMDSTLHNRTP